MVWSKLSWLLKYTSAPALTVSAVGAYAVFLATTVDAASPDLASVVLEDELDLESLPQAARLTTRKARAATVARGRVVDRACMAVDTDGRPARFTRPPERRRDRP